MECPRCALINPDGTLRCDCGYDFVSRVGGRNRMKTYPELKQRYLSSAIDGFLVLSAAIGIAGVLQSPDLSTARVLLISLLLTSYEPILTSKLHTVGQWVTGIRVRRHDDFAQRISLGRAYLRSVVKIILGAYSFFAMGFNDERRAAHDLAAGSIVLDARDSVVSPVA